MCRGRRAWSTSLCWNDSGSSSTSPSRLPRMLVEYQPRRPSMRALRPGAMTVFISVWPVLKSLPAMATWCSRASSPAAGKSTARFGAPFANGTPSFRQAHAYICELEMSGCSSRAPPRRRRSSGGPRPAAGTPRSSRTTRRRRASSPLALDEARDVRLELLDHRRLGRAGLHVGCRGGASRTPGRRRPSSACTADSSSLTGSRCLLLEHVGVSGGLVGVVREDVPAAEREVVERGERDEVLDERARSRRSACRAGWCPIWVSEPSGRAEPLDASMTPAIVVVATAPRPGSRTASFPCG